MKNLQTINMFLRAPLVLLLLFTLLLGGAYPLAVTAVSHMLFPHKTSGSLVIRGDRFVGSELLGQQFTQDKYFWGRLSATTPPYNAAASGGSNLSPANPKLLEAANARVAALRKADPGNKAPIPSDLVTASASGLDPHISPAAARWQIGRVARARRMKEEDVRALVDRHIEEPLLGFIGEARVNVLRLNMALDEK